MLSQCRFSHQRSRFLVHQAATGYPLGGFDFFSCAETIFGCCLMVTKAVWELWFCYHVDSRLAVRARVVDIFWCREGISYMSPLHAVSTCSRLETYERIGRHTRPTLTAVESQSPKKPIFMLSYLPNRRTSMTIDVKELKEAMSESGMS